jgi:hypothetical protein
VDTAREIDLRLGRKGRPPVVLVFLRSDIFDEIEFNDKNKMSADTERLEWEEDALVKVVEARIGNSLALPTFGAWERVFSTAEMRQRASVKSYIQKRCMGRPRDIVAFCIECQNVAMAAGTPTVDTEHVYEAEKAYSRHIFDELIDETHKQLPRFKSYLLALREMGKTKFMFTDWDEVAQRRGIAKTSGESRDALQVLFDFCVVGVLRRGGRSFAGKAGGSKFQFAYSDRLVEADFDREVVVHPALKKELNLVEQRRQGTSTDDDGE